MTTTLLSTRFVVCASWDSQFCEAVHAEMGDAIAHAANMAASEDWSDAAIWVEWEIREQRYLLAVFQELCED